MFVIPFNRIKIYVCIVSLFFTSAVVFGQDKEESELPDLNRVITYSGFPYPGPKNVECFVSLETPKLAYLHAPALVKQLELVGYQKKQLAELKEKVAKKAIRVAYAKDSEGNLFSSKEVAAKMKPVLETYEKDVWKILLPHQRDLLDRYPAYVALFEIGLPKYLLTSSFGGEHALTANEKEKLKVKIQKLREKLVREATKLEEEINKELLADLSPELKAKIKKLKVGLKSKDRVASIDLLLRHLDLTVDCQGCATSRPIGKSVLDKEGK